MKNKFKINKLRKILSFEGDRCCFVEDPFSDIKDSDLVSHTGAYRDMIMRLVDVGVSTDILSALLRDYYKPGNVLNVIYRIGDFIESKDSDLRADLDSIWEKRDELSERGDIADSAFFLAPRFLEFYEKNLGGKSDSEAREKRRALLDRFRFAQTGDDRRFLDFKTFEAMSAPGYDGSVNDEVRVSLWLTPKNDIREAYILYLATGFMKDEEAEDGGALYQSFFRFWVSRKFPEKTFVKHAIEQLIANGDLEEICDYTNSNRKDPGKPAIDLKIYKVRASKLLVPIMMHIFESSWTDIWERPGLEEVDKRKFMNAVAAHSAAAKFLVLERGDEKKPVAYGAYLVKEFIYRGKDIHLLWVPGQFTEQRICGYGVGNFLQTYGACLVGEEFDDKYVVIGFKSSTSNLFLHLESKVRGSKFIGSSVEGLSKFQTGFDSECDRLDSCVESLKHGSEPAAVKELLINAGIVVKDGDKQWANFEFLLDVDFQNQLHDYSRRVGDDLGNPGFMERLIELVSEKVDKQIAAKSPFIDGAAAVKDSLIKDLKEWVIVLQLKFMESFVIDDEDEKVLYEIARSSVSLDTEKIKELRAVVKTELDELISLGSEETILMVKRGLVESGVDQEDLDREGFDWGAVWKEYRMKQLETAAVDEFLRKNYIRRLGVVNKLWIPSDDMPKPSDLLFVDKYFEYLRSTGGLQIGLFYYPRKTAIRAFRGFGFRAMACFGLYYEGAEPANRRRLAERVVSY
jgi:hypothetical protein